MEYGPGMYAKGGGNNLVSKLLDFFIKIMK